MDAVDILTLLLALVPGPVSHVREQRGKSQKPRPRPRPRAREKLSGGGQDSQRGAPPAHTRTSRGRTARVREGNDSASIPGVGRKAAGHAQVCSTATLQLSPAGGGRRRT